MGEWAEWRGAGDSCHPGRRFVWWWRGVGKLRGELPRHELGYDGTDHTRGASCGTAAGIKGKHRPPSALWGLSPWADLTCSLPSYTSRAWDEASGTGDPLYTSSPPIEIEKNIVRACAA